MRRPSRPPAAFASSTHRSRPLRYSAAAAACEPVSEITAPTTSALSWAAALERAAAKTSALVIQPVIDRMAAHRDQRRALEGHEHRAVRLFSRSAHGHDAMMRARFRLALADHLGLGVDRVAREHRRREAHL